MNFIKNALQSKKNKPDELSGETLAGVEDQLLGLLNNMDTKQQAQSSRQAVSLNPVQRLQAVSADESGAAPDGSDLESSRQELSRILEAIRAQPEEESSQDDMATRVTEPEAGAIPLRSADSRGQDGVTPLTTAGDVLRQSRLSHKLHSSDASQVAHALDEVTAAVDRVLSTLPNKADAAQTWDIILEDMRELAKRRQRLVEIEQEFEATMRQIDQVIVNMNEHLQQTIVAEKEKIYSFQVRAKLAETLSARLREI